jgi:plastocyanin
MNKIAPAALTALLAAAAIGSTAVRPAEGAITRNVKVDDNFFAPTSLTISPGTTVKWRWVGRRPHNVTARGFASSTKRTGTYSRRFNRTGTRRVYCTLHSGMEMRVRVR